MSDEHETPGEAALNSALTAGLATLAPTERAAAEREIAAQSWILQPMLRAMAVDFPALRRRVIDMMPRTLFVLIPVLAIILALFYRGRHYPEHLYFAIHFQAFVFLALTLVAIAQYSRSLPLIVIAQAFAYVWVVGYAVVAQRRVYGGSWSATGLKAVGIAALYGLLWSTIGLGVTLWASRAG